MLELIESLQGGALDTRALRKSAASRTGGRMRPRTGALYRDAVAASPRRMASLLDLLDYGIVVLHDDGRVALANSAARLSLGAEHALTLDGDVLIARLPQDVAALRQAVLRASERGLRRLLHLGEGACRQTVAVVPLPPASQDEPHGVALLMGRRRVCEELTVDAFARLHGLTRTETVVIQGLCADLTPQEIAQRQGVGLATVRTQIGAIRSKTGAGGIRDLVRQVSQLPPLVHALQGQIHPTAAAVEPEPARLLS